MAPTGKAVGFQVEQVVLTCPSLPDDCPPLRFAHLSDLHLRVLRSRHQRLIEAVNEADLDMVFATGDLLSGGGRSLDLCERLFSQLQTRHGTFACRGNWEIRRRERRSTLRRLSADWGVRLLVNDWVGIETASGPVTVSGIDDLASGWPNFADALPPQREGFAILLSHAPMAGALLGRDAGVDLVLSGHTHGGQIRVPWLWRRVIPSCNGGMVEGLHRTDWGRVYVNRGFGVAALLPFRFRCPAEVTFFEVRPA